MVFYENDGLWHVYVLFDGNTDDDPADFSFPTKMQAQAFIEGLSAAVGHTEYALSDSNGLSGEPDIGPDESMDGDHESGLASAGWGTDEDYGCFGDADDFGGD